MKLWLLKPRQHISTKDNPWLTWYDMTFGFVIRARTEKAARKIAALRAGDEEGYAWTDATYSTCTHLTNNGEPGLIMEDYANA